MGSISRPASGLAPKAVMSPILVLTARDLSPEDHSRLNGMVQSILRKHPTTQDELLTEIRRRVVDRVRTGADATPAGGRPG